MRTVPFRSVYQGVLTRHGLDPLDKIPQNTGRAIARHITRRARYGWQYWPWPELSHTEERPFRTIWNSTLQFLRSNAQGVPDELFYLGDSYVPSLGPSAPSSFGPNFGYYVVLAAAPSDPPPGTAP